MRASRTSGRCTRLATIFGDFEFFSEGIFAFGDRFYIANHGSVHVEGESSSTIVGVGADGVVINFNVVESAATNSSVIVVDGDTSQFINLGQVISSGERQHRHVCRR